MPITVQGLASSRKTPGVYLAVVLGGTPTSAGDAPKKILVIGNKITADLTGAAPAFTVTAGTQGNAAPVFLPSADDAATLFGRGSEVHRMALAAFRQYPDALVYGCAVAESAGARADAVLTFATSATAAFTVRLTMGGKVIDVAVASGDSVTTIATNCADAILDEADLPVTAQFVLGVLTITAKCIGPRGNDLTLRAEFINAAGVSTEITTGVVTSPGSTTGQLSSVATVESTYFLDGGTTADDVTAALAAIATTKYDRIVLAHRDATNVDLVAAQVDSMAGVTTQLRQQFLYGTRATYATAVTLATGRNDSRGQCVWHYNSPTPIEEAVSAVAAARLIGDGVLGGTRVGEASRPSANLDGTLLANVRAQPFAAEQPTSTEIENALNNGLTPLQPSGSNPGFAEIVRSVTSRSLLAGVNNYAVIDTSTVTVCDYVADDLQADLAVTFAGKNLAADSADGSPPTAANVVTPSTVKARIAYKLGLYEEEGNTRDAAANMSLLAVVESATPGRLDCEVPVEPATPLHIIGGNIRQVA